MIDISNKSMLGLIKASIFGGPVEVPENTDWKKVLKQLKMHRIASLPYNLIGELPLDDAVRLSWEKYYLNQQLYYNRLLSYQKEVCVAFAAEGIPAAVMKGTASGVYYPMPSLRTMGDIDILVRPEDLVRCEEILLGLGYETTEGLDKSERHCSYVKEHIEVELHYIFAKSYTDEIADRINRRLAAALPDARMMSVDGVDFPAFPEVENGFIILYHLYIHIYKDLGLRQVIDWMNFARRCEAGCWDEINAMAQDAGIYTMQQVMTKLCVKYMGLPRTDAISWCENADDTLVDELLEYICGQGNFGSNLANDDYSGRISGITGIVSGFRRLQRGGICRWEAARKYRVLRPFAWIYQAVRVIIITLSRRDPIGSYKRDFAEGAATADLMKRLGLKPRQVG